MRLIAVIITAAVLATPTQTQEAPKPGPEHKTLKEREGTWTSTMKFGEEEAKGTLTLKMQLGGMWLVGNLESKLFGGKFQGKSLDTYSTIKKKYVSVWVDSMAGGAVVMEGTFDKKAKTMTMTGEGPGMDGASTKYKSVTKYPDKDTMEMTMYIGKGKDPAFTITYKRKKK